MVLVTEASEVQGMEESKDAFDAKAIEGHGHSNCRSGRALLQRPCD